MQPATKYLLLQVPGWILVALVVAILLHWQWIGARAAALVVVLWLAKDLVLYPLYRPALTSQPPATGAAALVGARGRSLTAVNGQGQVEVAGERWLARACEGGPIGAGTPVEVVTFSELELHVRSVEPDSGGARDSLQQGSGNAREAGHGGQNRSRAAT